MRGALVRGEGHPLFLYLLAWIVSVTSVTAGSVSKIGLACVSPSSVLPTFRSRIGRGECIRGRCRLLTCDPFEINACGPGEIGNRWEGVETALTGFGMWALGMFGAKAAAAPQSQKARRPMREQRPFFVPASRGDAEAIASTAGAIVIAARSLGRFDEIHRASRGCEGSRATKDVEEL